MYQKQLYVFDKEQPVPIVIRNYTEEDFPELIRVQQESFPPPFPAELLWNKLQLHNHISLFPEGALCVEVNGEIAGSMTGLRVNVDINHPEHSWEEITDGGYIRNHNSSGDTLYVVDIGVRPRYRKLGLGQWLMFSMYDVVVHQGIKRLLGGARMPGYHKVAGELTADEYVNQILEGRLKDPVITFLLRCGRVPVTVIPNYIEDEESLNHATLMAWDNPFVKEC